MKRLLFVFLFLAANASAQTFRLYGVGGKSLATWHGQADVRAFAVELEKPLSKRTELGFVIAPYQWDQPKSWFGDQYGDGNESVRALSVALVLRHHVPIGLRHFRPYGEVALGPMYAEKRVPASTSRFNFITQLGAGVTLMPERPISLVAGYRYQHISNGGYAPRNPGLNVHSVVLGVRVRR